MIGKRIPVVDGQDPWLAIIAAGQLPGSYYGPVMGFSGDVPAVFFLLPISRDPNVPPSARSLHHVCSPPHTFTEELDGTLTIRASIAAGGVQKPYWHGYLTKGEWTEC